MNRRLDNRYELRERVGSGGMAEVWEGFDHNLNRRIAIKMMHAHLAADQSILGRFRSEAQAAARLNHPAIVAIYDTVTTENNEAIIMEFVQGEDLRSILNDRPTLAAADAVEVSLQLAGALGHAHQNGIIHRDVKPANILVRPDRRVKLSDFGIAKALDETTGHTETGALMGTVKYLAPEQIEGHLVDGRTDLYGLATVLYEMLCGQVPFSATDLVGAMQRLRKDPPSARTLRPDIPLALDAFLQRALARNPDDRYTDANEWTAALRESTVGTRVVDRGDPTIIDKRPIPTAAASHPSVSETAQQSIPQAAARRPVAQPQAAVPAAPPPKSAQARSKPDPETAKHMKRSKSRIRWLGPLIAFILMVAAVATVWFLVTDAGDEFMEQLTGGFRSEQVDGADGDTTTNADSSDSGQGVTSDSIITTEFNADGLRATSFDPQGNDGVEHEEAVSRPFDGDVDTFWLTSRYGDRNFGQLKEGVGLIVEFAEPRSMEDLEIDASRVDWAFTLYAADTAQPTLAGWGEPINSFSNLGQNEVLDVDDRDVGSLLFWVTDLGMAPGQTAEEYEAQIAGNEIIQQLQISRIELVG